MAWVIGPAGLDLAPCSEESEARKGRVTCHELVPEQRIRRHRQADCGAHSGGVWALEAPWPRHTGGITAAQGASVKLSLISSQACQSPIDSAHSCQYSPYQPIDSA